MSFKDKILNNQSPWGTPPGGGSDDNGSGTRRDPPNIDDVIRNFQKTINKFSGGKSGGSRPIILGLIIIIFGGIVLFSKLEAAILVSAISIGIGSGIFFFWKEGKNDVDK